MILISHRGNTNGPLPEKENDPNYIDEALSNGFNVEIDIWVINNETWLGHDKPQYKVEFEWLLTRISKIWIHCKNIDGIIYFSNFDFYPFNYFWHETDTLTLTSFNYIWSYPGKQPIKKSIAVMPEIYNDDITNAIGICSDFIQNYK